jgi:hypothetical protein
MHIKLLVEARTYQNRITVKWQTYSSEGESLGILTWVLPARFEMSNKRFKLVNAAAQYFHNPDHTDDWCIRKACI